MKLREKIALWKQRRIFRKMQRCIDKILKYEPTIDGSFFSPAQLIALQDFYRYLEKFKTQIKVFIPYTSADLGFMFSDFPMLCDPFRLSKEQCEFLSKMQNVCRHKSVIDAEPEYYTCTFGTYVIREEEE